MNVLVRKIFPGDADAVVGLAAELSAFIGKQTAAFSVDDFRRYGFGSDRLFDGVIAEVEGRPVGYALFRDMYDMDLASPGLHMMDLFVQDHMGRQGVGRALLKALAQACAAIDGTWMTWQCLEQHHHALAFYQALGGRRFACVDFEISGPALRHLAAGSA